MALVQDARYRVAPRQHVPPRHEPDGPMLVWAASVRANQFPRGVSRADALVRVTITVNMPSRARSAMVIPYIRGSHAFAGCAHQMPRLL